MAHTILHEELARKVFHARVFPPVSLAYVAVPLVQFFDQVDRSSGDAWRDAAILAFFYFRKHC